MPWLIIIPVKHSSLIQYIISISSLNTKLYRSESRIGTMHYRYTNMRRVHVVGKNDG